MSARIARLQAEVTANRDALLKGAGDLNAVADERDDLRTDYDALIARLERSWPRCPDGCGCLMDGEDADRRECGCGGPCTMECRENGYPDAPSYRDLAVKHAMDEADSLRKELTTLRAEAEAAASSLITEAASQRSQRLPMLGTRLDGIARRLVNAASAREALEARDDG